MVDIFKLNKELSSQLVRLKEDFSLCAVKAEFEAEGASFRDLVRLRRITIQQGIPLYLKIGGAEAIRDIKDAFELGVDGLIAPMIESPFALGKFLSACKAIYRDQKIFKSINVETCQAAENIEDLLKIAANSIDNITIGRTDLSQSYHDEKIQPDSEFILNLIESLSQKVVDAGLTLTIGGSLTKASIERFRGRSKEWAGKVASLETRKIILPADIMLEKHKALEESIKFEELYLHSKLEIVKMLTELDRERLFKLKSRL
jgi:4-hydroxy-2-oxoheptanedioate aldolase